MNFGFNIFSFPQSLWIKWEWLPLGHDADGIWHHCWYAIIHDGTLHNRRTSVVILVEPTKNG